MAQHQLPLNSLCAERGGGPMDEEAGGNNFVGASPSGTYEGDPINRNHTHHQQQYIHSHHGRDNSFNGHHQSVTFTTPPPYSRSLQQQQNQQDDHCFAGSSAATTSDHLHHHHSSVHPPPPPPPLSGSLPPITSLGNRTLHHQQHNNNNPSQQHQLSCFGENDGHKYGGIASSGAITPSLMCNSNHQQQQHNSSGASSSVCSPASPFPPAGGLSNGNGGRMPVAQQQQQQQMRAFHQQQSNGSEFSPLGRMGGGCAIGQQFQFRQQHQQYANATATNVAMTSSPMMTENHHQHYASQHSQMKQLPSPAFSVHGMSNNNSANVANSVMSSNPGSIISAPPESPLSSHSVNINNNVNNNNSRSRSPSVRSNYSLQRMLVNSASTTPPEQQSQYVPPMSSNSQQNYGNSVGPPNGDNAGGRNELAQQQHTATSSSSLLLLLTDDQHQNVQNDSKASSCGEGDTSSSSLPLPNHLHSSTVTASNSAGPSVSANVGSSSSLSATLPPLQQSADTFSPSIPAGDIGRLPTDGPTVRQHLQQQQAAQRQRQQHESMMRRLCKQQQREESRGWESGVLSTDKSQSHQQNAQRRRPQIESAPPSVTTNIGGVHGGPSPCYFPPSVPSACSTSAFAAGGELQQQIMMVSAAPPLPPVPNSAPKTLSADSLLSPSKRGGRSRAVGGTRTKAATGGTAPTNMAAMTQTVGAGRFAPGASSADALASTIASVASGGGTFEFEKAIGTSPIPSSLSMSASALQPSGDSSAALFASAGGAVVPSTSSIHPQQLITSPGVKRRRTQQQTQAVSTIVNALTQPPPVAIDQQMPPNQPPLHTPGGPSVGDMLSHQLQQQPSLGMGGDPTQHEQITAPSQCRIHVQNPPQTHGDFPPTGTKIQVVHMQPPASAVSHHHQPMTPMSDNVSPQQQVAASRPVSARLSTLRPTAVDHHLPSSIPYDFHAANASSNGSRSSIDGFSQNVPSIAELSSSSTTSGSMHSLELAHHSSSSRANAVAAPPYPPYHHFPHSQQQHLAFVTPIEQTQQHYYDNTVLQQQQSPSSSSYQYNQQQQLQHQTLNHPSTTGFKQPPQPSHCHFSPGNNNLIANHNNGRTYRTFPQHFALQQQHQQQQMAMDGCSPILPPQPSPSMSGDHFPVQSPAQHPSTSSSSPSMAAILPAQNQHHQVLLQQKRYHLQQQHLMGGGPATPANLTSPQSIPVPHQQNSMISSKVAPFFCGGAPPSPFVCPAPPPVALNRPPPMGSPLPQRAQLSRAQLLSRYSRDVEARKCAVKLYHLQRTIKALVYKNGALADELARLNQRIGTVTAERKMLAKRLQHHERNRIRRIQSQYRKAIAAAAAKPNAVVALVSAKEEAVEEGVAEREGMSGSGAWTGCAVVAKTKQEEEALTVS